MVYTLLKSFPFYRADCSTTNVSHLENVTRRSTCDLSRNQRIGIYAGTTAAAILINFARTIAFYFICVNASRVLHNRMFAAVLRAPVLFFDTNPIGEQVSVFLCLCSLPVHSLICSSICLLSNSFSVPTAGRVLNRFSKDVGFLDDLLPFTFCEYLLVSRNTQKHAICLNKAHTHCALPNGSLPTVACIHFDYSCSFMFITASPSVPGHHIYSSCFQLLGVHPSFPCHGSVSFLQMVLPQDLQGDKEAGGNW